LAQSGATNSVALGSYSITSGFSGVAVGSSASATNGTAIGMASTASNGGSALGFGSTATNSSVALGGGATATGYNSVAIGNLSTAEEDNTVSLGSSTFGITRRVTNMADGINDSDGATVRQVNVVAAAAANAQSTADYAVSGVSALNANLYSTAVTIGANAVQVQGAVSFGDGAGNNLKLTNIANGVVAAGSSDAVTGDQLNTTNQAVTKAQTTADTAIVTSGQALAIAQQTQAQVKVLTGRVDALDGRVTSLESRMDGYDRRINGGVAISSAMNAAVAPSLAPGESALLGGVGSFKGQAALSMGIAHTNYAGQSFTAKVSTSSIGTAFALGGAVKF
jgi:autotransporter adhesin